MKTKLYLFDFDGTLTHRDTLLEIIRFHAGTLKFVLGMLRFSPQLVLMKLKLYPNYQAKERVFRHFFGGLTADAFQTICNNFAQQHHSLLRPKAIACIQQAQQEGAEIMIVSASIDTWVKSFLPNVTILGTQIEVKDGIVTGRFQTPNCYGAEKVRRVKAQLSAPRNTYFIKAYGDSRGDKEMLAFADEAHYKPFQ